MIKVDLITGFLGSGKTTFIKKYARHLLDTGYKIGILENDFGAVNVDMMLLNELQGENCELSMVAGGCDPDCHKRRFKTKLISMGMVGYDRILIEPSGIFDVDEFFDVLHEEPLNQWYEIGNVIAIVDAGLEEELSVQSEFFLASQVANAGRVIFSKIQEVEKEDLLRTINHLDRAMEAVQCGRKFAKKDIFTKNWSDFTSADWREILESGYKIESYVKLAVNDKNDYNTLYYMNVRMSRQELKNTLWQLMNNPDYAIFHELKGSCLERMAIGLKLTPQRKRQKSGLLKMARRFLLSSVKNWIRKKLTFVLKNMHKEKHVNLLNSTLEFFFNKC